MNRNGLTRSTAVCRFLSAKKNGKPVPHGCKKEFGEPKNTSKALVRGKPIFHEIDGACYWQTVMYYLRQRVSDLDQKTAQQWLDDIFYGTSRARREVCYHDIDKHTPLYIRAIQGHCSLPKVEPLCFASDANTKFSSPTTELSCRISATDTVMRWMVWTHVVPWSTGRKTSH